MERAPYFADVADGPEDGAAWWLHTEDGVRIRMGAWPLNGARGTVLIFPGRTEYVEKYGRVAARLATAGYASVAIDWRGQGLADRLLPDVLMGHVAHFSDYQRDLAAVLTAVEALALPRPYFLLAHSMGGCIGLRSLIEGLDVEAAAFSAPMWNIVISPFVRPFARLVTGTAVPIGLGHAYVPSTDAACYASTVNFAENRLTRDREGFEYMRRQLDAYPELRLGGPSLVWLHEAMGEMRELRAATPPDVPAYAAVGTLERIVEPQAIHSVVSRWPGARLEIFAGAAHELLMERPAVRDGLIAAAVALFEGAPLSRSRAAAAR